VGVEPGSVIDYTLVEAARQESKNAMAGLVGTAGAETETGSSKPCGGKNGRTGRPTASRNRDDCDRSMGAATLKGKKKK